MSERDDDPKLETSAKVMRGVSEVLQSVEDALFDAGWNEMLTGTERGCFDWRTSERWKIENDARASLMRDCFTALSGKFFETVVGNKCHWCEALLEPAFNLPVEEHNADCILVRLRNVIGDAP